MTERMYLIYITPIDTQVCMWVYVYVGVFFRILLSAPKVV